MKLLIYYSFNQLLIYSLIAPSYFFLSIKLLFSMPSHICQDDKKKLSVASNFILCCEVVASWQSFSCSDIQNPIEHLRWNVFQI